MTPLEASSSLRRAIEEPDIHPQIHHRPAASSVSHLRPDVAYHAQSAPRKVRKSDSVESDGADASAASAVRKKRARDRGRSGSRRRKGTWKKLLWVKQDYPDNHTDEETFLDHLQRNPRLQPYEFWPLVADSTVIVQHVCSVVVFACCFAGIITGRVSPVAVVSWGSIGTVLGWVLWDFWVGQEEAANAAEEGPAELGDDAGTMSSSSSVSAVGAQSKEVQGLGLIGLSVLPLQQDHSHNASSTSLHSANSSAPQTNTGHATGAATFANYAYYPPYGGQASSFSPRNQQRLATAKSAILIYCALLGLSPILKSLTKSTSSDSIWAIS
ncbi:hypothetical protein B0A49_12231, partial [Cryomyces minteri]